MHSTTTPHNRAKAAPLSPLKRRVLRDLVATGGYTARELADHLECSEITVKRAFAAHRAEGQSEVDRRLLETMKALGTTAVQPRRSPRS